MSPKGTCQPRLKLARVRAGMPEFVGRGPLWPEPRRRAEEEKEMQRRACVGTALATRGSQAQGPAFLCRAAEATQGTWPPVPILPVSLAARAVCGRKEVSTGARVRLVGCWLCVQGEMISAEKCLLWGIQLSFRPGENTSCPEREDVEERRGSRFSLVKVQGSMEIWELSGRDNGFVWKRRRAVMGPLLNTHAGEASWMERP